MPKTVTEAYRVISEGLLEGFRSLGLEAYFAIPRSEEEKNSLKNPRSSVCFDAPSWYELVVEGRKIAGSAQTRQKGVILQHGSILLEIDEDKLFSVFNYPNDRVKERMQRAFRSKAVAINAIAGRKISIEEAKKAFYKGFASALDIDLEPYTLSEEEEAYVEELARTKYGSDEWNFKR
jgi:lipoate-protein ligase A